MGMAASQARYLALSARKSNVEYEGQQINQSRTALANQSANLFNQMLNMSVPTPPSIVDFTTVQYSFTDGYNTEVLSNYYQLGKDNEDFNYVVTTFHNEKVFTGSRKKLNDPQIQATIENKFSYDPTSFDQNDEKIVTKAWKNDDGTYGIETSEDQTSIFKPVTLKEQDQVKAINAGNGNTVTTAVTAEIEEQENQDASAIADWAPCSLDNAQDKAALIAILGEDGVNADDFDATTWSRSGNNFVETANIASTDTTIQVATFTEETEPVGVAVDADGNALPEQDLYTDGISFITKADLESAVTKYDNYVATGYKEKNDVNYIVPQNDRTFSNYTAVGNCRLTELTLADMADEDIKTEIDQIIKDMKGPNGDTIAAENLSSCFEVKEDGSVEYKGGIYSFKMGGTTYYTTEKDLQASVGTSIVDNDIDVQQKKLNYYNAIYQDTKVETTQKALLQTDGKGRFNSMKLEDDSVVYALNVEETTDEAAYNDAMNQYYYQNAIYEQTISEINAKTEIIHAQDRTLELRLQQLATEQSALQNEMEAVKKVVDKHVEQGFKTFGG